MVLCVCMECSSPTLWCITTRWLEYRPASTTSCIVSDSLWVHGRLEEGMIVITTELEDIAVGVCLSSRRCLLEAHAVVGFAS